ncbi:MAG: PEGA domain-containing protein [Gammaproteobacteria bacterium]|nr:PEGA domain-containing protein [Gammaproteobacteria bacterium]
MSRLFVIHDERGERRLDESDFPLSLGGIATGDIILPDVAADVVVAHIAIAESHPYIQPATDAAVELFHNHEYLNGSTWLKSGDEVQAGEALLLWQVQGDQVFVSVRRRAAAATLVPPDQPPPSQAEDTAVTPPAAMPDVAVTPATGSAYKKWRWPALAAFVVLLLATAFVLLATPVAISISPPPAAQSLQGFPPAVTVGERLLALPGRYTVNASLPGYFPLQQPIVINMGEFQDFQLQLQPLPGRVKIELDPAVDYQVFAGETVFETDAGGITAMPRGRHQLRIETGRYLPVTAEVDIAGLGEQQQFSYQLQPGWATVQLLSEPAGADVQLDGEPLGVTPLNTEIMHGKRTLQLSLELHKTVTLQQQFVAGSSLKLTDIVLPPADGTLALSTLPPGATISVSGEYLGTTPASLTLASGKQHTLRLTRPGYQAIDKNIQLQPQQQQELELAMSPQYGVVFVKASPADASLAIDGKPAGKATRRLSLSTRAHTLEISKPGYISQQRTVTPRSGVSKNVDVTLKTAEQVRQKKQAAATPPALTTAAGQLLHRVRPAGSFQMGASRREAGRRANESARLVQLSRPFYLGANEVTNAEYRRYQSAHSSGSAEGVSLNGDKQPVVNVSWDEAARYCNWLSAQDGLPAAYRENAGKMTAVVPATSGYRLPTEAEWVYVARKLGRQQMARYSWSGSFPPTAKTGNFADASIADTLANVVPGYNDGYRGTAPVGSFPARPAGYHDLGGNVAEWMNDYYAVYPGMAAQLVTDPGGPETGDHRVVRDSSWRQGTIGELRLSYRDYSRAGRADLGFRIARYAQ